MKRHSWLAMLAASLAVGAATIGGASAAFAQSNAIASGDWSAAGTWNPAEPVAGGLATIDGSLTVDVTAAGEAAGRIDLGTIATQTGNLTIAAGSDLTISGGALPSIRVGTNTGGIGNVTMTGGTVAINGAAPSGFAIGDLLVGDNGKGTWSMSGGTFTAADEVFVGLGGTSDGSALNVSGGNFTIAGRNLLVAFFGGADASFNLSGTGIVNVDEFLFSSFDPGTTSTINQTGGTLNVGGALVHGRQGNATYNHSAGTAAVTTLLNNGDFVIGDNGPNNFYNISGTAVANAGRDFLVGVFGAAQATVNQSGGTVNIGRVLRVGIDGVGTWNQTGGTTTVAGSAWFGDFDTSLGTLKSSGGTLNITGNLSVGAALASNAPAAPTGTDGQALDADGTLIVSGSGGDINIGGNLLANPGDHTRRRVDLTGDNVSNLIFEILDNTGVSRVDAAGIANLNGAIIDVDVLGGSFALGSTFDLITATTISNNYVQNAEDAGSISLAIVAGGNGQILRATLVPEPAAAVLAALAGLGLALGRRRSMDLT